MTSRLFGSIFMLTLLGVSTASAQPPLPSPQIPRGPITFRGFAPPPGHNANQSQISLWAGQVTSNAQSLRAVCNAIPLPGPQKIQLLQAGDQAVNQANGFHQLTLNSMNMPQILAAHRTMDAAVDQFIARVQPYGARTPGLSQAISNLQYADERLHAALGGSTPGVETQRNIIVRLARTVDDHASELRAIIDESNTPGLPGGGRDLSRGLRSYADRAGRLSRDVESGTPIERARREFNEMEEQWRRYAPQVAVVASRNPRVRVHAAQLEGLKNELARALGATVVPPGPILPGPILPGPVPPGPFPPGPIVPPPLPEFGIITKTDRVFVTAAGENGGPHIRVYHDINTPPSDFFAYDPNYRGGVRIAVADLNGDGFPDVITAPGTGMPPLIRVFSGRDLSLLTEFIAYDAPYDLGTYVAAADLTRDGKALIAVGPGVGGPPHVKIFDLAAGKMIDEFYPYPRELRCGARVAMGDIDGDGVADVVTAPGAGNGPHIRIFSGINRALIKEFNAYEDRWRGGVFIATADVSRNNRAEIITGTDAGGPARVRVFDGLRGRMIGEIDPYPAQFRGGVRVAAFDVNRNGQLDVICAPGPGAKGMPVRMYDGRNSRFIGDLSPYGAAFDGGVYLGAK